MPREYVIDLPHLQQHRALRPVTLGDYMEVDLVGAYNTLAHSGLLFLAGMVVGAYVFSGGRKR